VCRLWYNVRAMSHRPSVLYCCFDALPSPKGAGTHVRYFVEALAQRYAVTLVSIDRNARADNTLFGARHRVISLPQENYLDRAMAYREAIWDVLEDETFDLVHFRTMWAALPVAEEKARQGFATICEVNAVESIELKYHYPSLRAAPELLGKLRKQEALAFFHADALITPSQVTKRYLLRHQVPEERVTVIPNGVDTTRFLPMQPALSETLTLLYVGTQAPWQGLDILLQALQKVVPHYPLKLQLLCPTSRKWSHPLRKMIRKLGLSDVIEELPPVSHDDVPAVIMTADICVAPLAPTERNLVQGCHPIKLLEYMACGKAIIASDLPVVREILTDDETALLFKVSKPSRLAECLVRLAEDTALRRRLGDRAAVVAGECFTWIQAQEALLACYERVLSSTSRYSDSSCVSSVSGA
jgi:glycosyltransferase involved in cell wall biosynthesis